MSNMRMDGFHRERFTPKDLRESHVSPAQHWLID